jgi:hypothetical protein
MRWFRQHIRVGGRLGLFALAVHMALSFGHVRDLAAGGAGHPIAVTSDLQQEQLPAHPYPGSTAHDYCAICANIGVLGSLILPAPAALFAPQASARVWFPVTAAAGLAGRERSFNQARGPPPV